MSRILALLLLSLALVAGACASDDTATTDDAEVVEEIPAGDDAGDDGAADDAGLSYSADVTLTGDAEVPGPGAEGSGEAVLTIADGEACIEGSLDGVGAVSAGHIHTGTASESGGVLLALDVTTEEDGAIDSCVPIDDATAQQIIDDPAGFYVNLHTADFPDGAVRGQLS